MCGHAEDGASQCLSPCGGFFFSYVCACATAICEADPACMLAGYYVVHIRGGGKHPNVVTANLGVDASSSTVFYGNVAFQVELLLFCVLVVCPSRPSGRIPGVYECFEDLESVYVVEIS